METSVVAGTTALRPILYNLSLILPPDHDEMKEELMAGIALVTGAAKGIVARKGVGYHITSPIRHSPLRHMHRCRSPLLS
jgi:hypothetical protein